MKNCESFTKEINNKYTKCYRCDTTIHMFTDKNINFSGVYRGEYVCHDCIDKYFDLCIRCDGYDLEDNCCYYHHDYVYCGDCCFNKCSCESESYDSDSD